MTRRKPSRRDSIDQWLELPAKVFGYLCIAIGIAGFIASGFTKADQTIFGTGVLLIGGGHVVELGATLRKPPEEPR